MSIKKGSRTIASSVPVTEWGSVDGTLADQADLKSALDSKAPTYSPTFTGTPIAPTAPVGAGSNQIATTKYVQDALLNAGSDLPNQTGHAGQFLKTDGSLPSWATVDALPSQSGQSGKFLTTNGTTASWGSVDISGKVDKTNLANRVYGTNASSEQTQIYYSNAPYNNAIALFGGGGQLKSNAPTADNDVVNLSYLTTNYDTKTAYKSYIASRGENLITNGSQLLGNNTNWSQATFDGSDANGSGGCIKTSAVNTFITEDEQIPVDITKCYMFSFDVKTTNGAARYYDTISSFDIDNNNIQFYNCHWISGSTTELTQDLNPGDTVVHLANVSGWNKTSTQTYHHGFLFWGYKNSYGYEYPVETYSRYMYRNLWSDSSTAIDTTNNTITLASGWTGPAFTAGTKVSQCTDGGNYIYIGTQNYTLTPDVWVHRDSYLSPADFRPGTAYIKIGWLANREVSSSTTKWTNITFTSQLLLESPSLKGIPTAPTANAGTNTTQIATTEFVKTAVDNAALSGGTNISITNNTIDYTGPRYYRLGTRTWTYAQWKQYCDRGVTTNISPSFVVTGIKSGDLVTVEGTCSDKNNASALAWGIAQGEPAEGTNNVAVLFLGFNVQETITKEKTFDLFDHKWADHTLNDVSWLRADTFSWQDGSVYELAYNHLTNDISDAQIFNYDLSIQLESGSNKYILTLAKGSVVTGPSGSTYTLKSTPGIYGSSSNVGEEWYCFKSLGSGSEYIESCPASAYYVQSTAPTPTYQYAFWYDTSTNTIKTTSNTGSTWYGNYSYPLGKYINRGSNGFNSPADLIENYSGIQGLETETIGSYTIKYYPAADGHKIIMPDQETAAANIYNESGVAWYYILDTANTRFKLPRTKFAFTGLRDTVGKYVAPGLPNITGSAAWGVNGLCADGYSSQGTPYNNSSGALYATKDGGAYGAIGSQGSDSASTNTAVNINASRSSPIYGNSTTVQPPATQQYLYFYVGEYSESAVEQTAGITTAQLNAKVDLPNGINQSDVDYVIDFQRPTSSNNYTWYRLYKSGWVEQGGIHYGASSAVTYTITLPKQMSNANYSITLGCGEDTSNSNVFLYWYGRTTTQFVLYSDHTSSGSAVGDCWEVKGFAA